MGDRVIGDASEFYRARMVKVDDSGAPDLEWRDDILYRRPPEQAVEEYALYRIEVMDNTSEDVVTSLGEFESHDEASALLDEVQDAIATLTKKVFDSRYLGLP